MKNFKVMSSVNDVIIGKTQLIKNKVPLKFSLNQADDLNFDVASNSTEITKIFRYMTSSLVT